jgi:hypothetical protein
MRHCFGGGGFGGGGFGGGAIGEASQQSVPILDAVMQQIMLFVQGKAACQSVEDDEEGDEGDDEEEEDHDFILMDSVTDLVGGLARAIGPEFAPFVMPLLQPLGRFLAPSRPHTDKSMAIGCYADLVSSIGPALGANTAGSLLQVGMSGLADTSGGGEVQVSVGGCLFAIAGGRWKGPTIWWETSSVLAQNPAEPWMDVAVVP